MLNTKYVTIIRIIHCLFMYRKKTAYIIVNIQCTIYNLCNCFKYRQKYSHVGNDVKVSRLLGYSGTRKKEPFKKHYPQATKKPGFTTVHILIIPSSKQSTNLIFPASYLHFRQVNHSQLPNCIQSLQIIIGKTMRTGRYESQIRSIPYISTDHC